MKIAFFTYPAAFQNIGGGEIQLLKTKEYLEKEGLRIDFFDMWTGKIENYDLLHVFGSVKDCLGLVRVAKKRKVKVVISPVFWSDFRRALFSDGGLMTKTDLFMRHLTKIVCPIFPSLRRNLLLESDLILPNSEMEKRQLARLFAVTSQKMRVVYNGVDEEMANGDPRLFRSQHGDEPFILSVGRVEPRKNQLNLIRAVKKIKGVKLILIGSAVSGHEGYDEKCRKEGQGFATFIPTLPHSDPLFRSAYAACEVFVAPGWFETPGLVALEAALAGAKMVVTKGGCTREYFADHIDYVDPSSVNDIYDKISSNLKKLPDPRLKRHIANHFTWRKSAQATLQSYHELIG